MPNSHRAPRTKEALIDRMMSRDFDGDLAKLGADRIRRTAPNAVELEFPSIGRTYELSVHMHREPRKLVPAGVDW